MGQTPKSLNFSVGLCASVAPARIVMNHKIKTLGIEFPRGRRAAPAPQPAPTEDETQPPLL